MPTPLNFEISHQICVFLLFIPHSRQIFEQSTRPFWKVIFQNGLVVDIYPYDGERQLDVR